MINRIAFYARLKLSSSVMGQEREGGRRLQGHTQRKEGKPQQSRGCNKANQGVLSTRQRYNRQTRYRCDFDQKEKKLMRKEQMIKSPTSLVK